MAMLMFTQSHSHTSAIPLNEYSNNFFSNFVKFAAPKMAKYHAKLVEQAKTTPTFNLSFEELR